MWNSICKQIMVRNMPCHISVPLLLTTKFWTLNKYLFKCHRNANKKQQQSQRISKPEDDLSSAQMDQWRLRRKKEQSYIGRNGQNWN
jgi:hypothetical protein